jgi:hypothetical protein
VYAAVGGSGSQDTSQYTMLLPGDIQLDAPYGRANLPVLCLVQSPFEHPQCFWSKCFGFKVWDQDLWARNILDASNQNLTLAQKELLLWHQRLSHAGLSSIHNLVCQRRSVKVESEEELVDLRSGPILPCTYNVPKATCDGLLCAACENAKASRRPPSVRGTYLLGPSQYDGFTFE